MIVEVLGSELFRFKFHGLGEIILKIPEVNLAINCENWLLIH